MDFIIAGTAAVGAGFFSNPLEVIKTRMQFQGELNAKGQYEVHYKNTIHAAYNMAKHDGILSLQKGLVPALWVQFILNGTRLGVYQFLENRGLLYDENGKTVFYKSALIGGFGAIAGQYLCSPVYLVKTHLQTRSVESIAVGHQHSHVGMNEALRNIFKEHGSMDFVIAGSAACAACVFTNPLEVLKTRMQLQGELRSKGHHAIHYKNVVHAGYNVAKHEGLLALQKGLVSALYVQLILNGSRLGTFQFGESHGYVRDKKGNLVFYKSVLVGGSGGIAGQVLCSPFFLVKTHFQSQAAKNIAVGYQHNHQGTWSALYSIFSQNGFKGLFRGAASSVPRAFVGSVAQLTSFKYCKEYLNQYEYWSGKPILTSFCGSMVGGLAISVMMTPFDLIMTRLYNQPVDGSGKGLMYGSYFDCIRKIYKTEGAAAFYKGVGPMYLRLGPHSVLCLMFWDELQALYDKYKPQGDTKVEKLEANDD